MKSEAFGRIAPARSDYRVQPGAQPFRRSRQRARSAGRASRSQPVVNQAATTPAWRQSTPVLGTPVTGSAGLPNKPWLPDSYHAALHTRDAPAAETVPSMSVCAGTPRRGSMVLGADRGRPSARRVTTTVRAFRCRPRDHRKAVAPPKAVTAGDQHGSAAALASSASTVEQGGDVATETPSHDVYRGRRRWWLGLA